MIFQECFSQLDEHQRGHLMKLFEKWKVCMPHGHIWIENLVNERFLERKDMSFLLREIANKSKESEAIQTSFHDLQNLSIELRANLMKELDKLANWVKMEFCFSRMRLRGGQVKCGRPVTTGLVIPYKRLENFYRENNLDLFGGDQKRIRDFIENIESYKNRINYASLNIREPHFLVWKTFNSDYNDSDPFPFCEWDYNTPNDLRMALGLGNEAFKGKLVVLFYNNQNAWQNTDEYQLFRPTFCDASFDPFFAPPEFTEERYGQTKPYLGLVNDEVNISRERHPECVLESCHVRIKFVKQLKILRQ